jgi:ABC-type antimicrobial peptide transport system permease subunit
MERVVADATAEWRFEMLLLGVFAGLALVLAAVGIYGVVAYSVARRVREIGIRLALGATRSDVIGMVVRQGLTQTGLGTLAGGMGALLLARFMAGMLYGVEATDPVTFGGVTAVLAAAALGAACVPALRATRVEPVTALRSE